ncbi:lysine transporter LysE [Sedimentitalea sp. CY04]|uniref:Lysine transporter LysE n=1 Tax=Parasedimentitalea denitrificans TaxID=2211118 RepID=A0ABX0W725_9RHOB|nr:LysE family translocator [Sedimentitalea sp. CY04]NIZ60515.1 lysine transporter LysE [Sedimentitalea sp. CY04]
MTQTLVSLAAFLFPLAYSPGPGNMFFAANGARFGLLATLRANFGYHLATWLVTAAIGLGFVTTLDRFPQIFVLLKWAGAVYVFWLAWKLIRSGVLQGNESARPASFVDGAVLLLLNPKGYVIIALMFSQFLTPSNTDAVTFILLITTAFTLNNFIAFVVWTMIGDQIASHFRSPDSARRLNTLFGGMLALVAMWMLIS